MNFWITVDFGCARNQETSLCSLCKTKHIEGAHEGRLDCFYRVELIVRWRSWASQMVDFYAGRESQREDAILESKLTITFDHERLDHIVPDHFEVWMTNPMADCSLRSGEEIV
jgi:hypothetical protein